MTRYCRGVDRRPFFRNLPRITFFDNCSEYHLGIGEDWMGKGLNERRDRAFLITKVSTHGRDKDLSLRMLDESLNRCRP